jgi:hypothetical protein
MQRLRKRPTLRSQDWYRTSSHVEHPLVVCVVCLDCSCLLDYAVATRNKSMVYVRIVGDYTFSISPLISHYPIRPKNDLQLQVKDKRFVVLCRTPEHLAVYLQKIASLLGIVSATQHVRNSIIRPDVAGVHSTVMNVMSEFQ